MALSRGELKGKILRLLNKTAGYQGFYDDDKVNDVIEDCQDYVAAKMFSGGEGWMRRIYFVDTNGTDASYPIPPGIAIIEQLRYLIGNQYLPLIYDDGSMSPQTAPQAGFTQFPFRWRFIDNRVYFNPPPAQYGAQYLQIEAAHYPARLLTDGQQMDPQFDMAMFHYMKWRAASLLASQVGKSYKEWQSYEDQWFEEMQTIINKRIRTMVTVKEFDP